VAATASPPEPAGAVDYYWTSNTLSPKYKDYGSGGGCIYRRRFGNFGSVPYAQVRYYAGNCGGTNLGLRMSDGIGPEDTYHGTAYRGGTDSCGSYIEGQITGPSGYIATGQTIYFDSSSGNMRHASIYARDKQAVFANC
jgi:hypothetical protein